MPAFVYIVDDDKAARESLGDLLRSLAYQVMLYGTAAEFLEAELPDAPACLVPDVRLRNVAASESDEWRIEAEPEKPAVTGFRREGGTTRTRSPREPTAKVPMRSRYRDQSGAKFDEPTKLRKARR